MSGFSGMTVIVTGAGAGIGKAAALAFAEAGASRLIVNARTESCLSVKADIERRGCACDAVIGDIALESTVDRLFEAAGMPDVLVNCAGIVPQGDLERTDMDEWDRAFNTNVKAIFLTCREAVKRMRGRGGAIVNVASVAGFKGLKNRALYSATKGAVIALTKSMAAEYITDGIRINAISPGTVYSPSLQARIDTAADPVAEKLAFERRQPLGRLGTPEEIATGILFLADPANSYMTGVNLVCDGGATI
ncbi:MAG: SDR family oxidoreductase [Clostridia bacterium]|nr:SDR family oxidoreductase [Clostridia bacterium]